MTRFAPFSPIHETTKSVVHTSAVLSSLMALQGDNEGLSLLTLEQDLFDPEASAREGGTISENYDLRLEEIDSSPIAPVEMVEGVSAPNADNDLEFGAAISRRAQSLEAIHRKCDAYAESLRVGGAIVPAHPDRPDEIHYNELARRMNVGRDKLRMKGIRERIRDWGATFGLVVPRRERKTGELSNSELAKVLLSKRKRELKLQEKSKEKTAKQSAADLANTRWAVSKLKTSFGDDADAKSSIAGLLALADAGEVAGGKKLHQELMRCATLLDSLSASGDLPSELPDLIQFAMDRSGVTDGDVVRDLGIHRPYIWGLRTGNTVPCLWLYEEHAQLERYLHLPKDAIFSRACVRRRGFGQPPTELFPEEFRGRKNRLRFEMLKYLTPGDFVADPVQRHANIRRVADMLMANPSKYGEVIQKLSVFQYRWGEDEWQGSIGNEWDRLASFRTATIVPYGLKRKGKLLRKSSLRILQVFFSSLFGTWSAISNPVFTIDPRDVSFAYLLFPRLFHIRLEVASGWSEQAGADAVLSAFDINKLSDLRGLLDPETGWLTQAPDLAERLRPIVGANGEVIVSQEQIDWTKSNWAEACEKARKEYGAIRRSHAKSVTRKRDPFEGILPILRLENPFIAFAMLCQGLQNEVVEPRSPAHACLIRDRVMAGIMVQCAPRNETLSSADVDHLTYDKDRREWILRIPRRLFKNENGPYFVSANGEVRDYEWTLIDQYGLYDAIEEYFGWVRESILAGNKTKALLVCAPRRLRKARGLRRAAEPGRILPATIKSITYRLTARHVGFKTQTKAGIEGIKHFPPHAFRHILATGTLKLSDRSDRWQKAADAIHDSVDAVRKHYARYVPRDRADDLRETMRTGFKAAAK
jgi:hypothetical protein